MVARITSGSSPAGALYYNKEKVDKGEAKVLLAQNTAYAVYDGKLFDVRLAMQDFQPYLDANRRTKMPVFHVSLNPAPQDRLSDQQLRDIAQEYMERMGYGGQPYYVFKHTDIDREHLHIVSLRVGLDGRKLPHDFEAKRSMEILRDQELKYGLRSAVKGEEQAGKVGLRKVNYREGNVKQQLTSVIRTALHHYRCSSFGELRTLLECFNIRIEERTGTIHGRDYAGIIYGALNDQGRAVGTPIKASRMGRDVGYKALQHYYDKSREALRESGVLDALRETVGRAKEATRSRTEFKKILQKENIDAIFRTNAAGRIYGVTFIDHTSGIAANGSMLGREFVANEFENHFVDRQKESPTQIPSIDFEAIMPQQHEDNMVSNAIIIGSLLDIFDNGQAYEEQQIEQQRRRKKKQRIKR